MKLLPHQCFGSGSVLDPYSKTFWIRIRIRITDQDPGASTGDSYNKIKLIKLNLGQGKAKG